MPLHSDEETFGIGRLGGFDNAIRAESNNTQTLAKFFDSLMVARVYFESL